MITFSNYPCTHWGEVDGNMYFICLYFNAYVYSVPLEPNINTNQLARRIIWVSCDEISLGSYHAPPAGVNPLTNKAGCDVTGNPNTRRSRVYIPSWPTTVLYPQTKRSRKWQTRGDVPTTITTTTTNTITTNTITMITTTNNTNNTTTSTTTTLSPPAPPPPSLPPPPPQQQQQQPQTPAPPPQPPPPAPTLTPPPQPFIQPAVSVVDLVTVYPHWVFQLKHRYLAKVPK